MARLLCLQPRERRLFEVECNGLDDYYKHLGCDCFDIANREVAEGARFDIFCDDVGLFVEDNPVSAVMIGDNGCLEPMLVGNLIFARHNDAGETISLTDHDIELIRDKYIEYSRVDEDEIFGAVVLSNY